MLALHTFVFLLGILINVAAMFSALRTFILPRSARDPITALVFRAIRSLFNLRLRRMRTYAEQDRLMAYYAPLSLLMLLPFWLLLALIGFMFMFWGSGVESWSEAFTMSGSSLLTLGFSKGETTFQIALAFVEATIGLIFVALLIAYLPTMYSAFSRREMAVTLLESRAGTPPSPVDMLLRYLRIQGLERLPEVWQQWETWFAELNESHTSLAALVFFRSPQPEHSWLTAASAVLDAASLTLSTVDVPWEPQAALCIRSGYLALRRIADFFQVPYNPDPQFPADPIRISREEFDEACALLAGENVPLKDDLDQAWRDFAGWRVNYDAPLAALCRLVMAPEAPWLTEAIKATLQFTPPR